MGVTELVLIMLALGGGMLLIVIVWGLSVRNRQRSASPDQVVEETFPNARLDPGERQASHVSEQIEEMVRMKLAARPDLADIRLDFGTASDGSLEIWVDQVRYTNVDDIPDSIIRAAVSEAVAEFNL